jgi:TPR repeat protein
MYKKIYLLMFVIVLLCLPLSSTLAADNPQALLRQAQAGDVNSMIKLANAYYTGEGVGQDYAQAFTWYEKALAKNNSPNLQHQLGKMYEQGLGVKQDICKAFAMYEKAANQGLNFAIYTLAQMYEKGWCKPQNLQMAKTLYQRAGSKGWTEAVTHYARLNSGDKPAPVPAPGSSSSAASRPIASQPSSSQSSKSHAAIYNANADLRARAQAGDARAMYEYGNKFHRGDDTDENTIEAFTWFEKAAQRDNRNAQSSVGYYYWYGYALTKSRPQDYCLAVEWYEKAAKQGDGNAMAQLGIAYKDGRCYAQSYLRAAECFFAAYETGDPYIQNNVEHMYLYDLAQRTGFTGDHINDKQEFLNYLRRR